VITRKDDDTELVVAFDDDKEEDDDDERPAEYISNKDLVVDGPSEELDHVFERISRITSRSSAGRPPASLKYSRILERSNFSFDDDIMNFSTIFAIRFFHSRSRKCRRGYYWCC
jgi:hypothetical protein